MYRLTAFIQNLQLQLLTIMFNYCWLQIIFVKIFHLDVTDLNSVFWPYIVEYGDWKLIVMYMIMICIWKVFSSLLRPI